MSGWQQEKVCLGCISRTLKCRKLKPCRDIGWGYRFVLSWCDFDFTFDLAVVTLIFNILSRLHIRNHKVQEVVTSTC